MKAPDLTVVERIAGGLLGVATGDAFGSTLELTPPRRRGKPAHLLHTEIVGGGAFGWRPGEGTDDTDLTWAVVQAYLDGYSIEGVADQLLAWFQGRPRDVGGTTAAALRAYRTMDPMAAGRAVARNSPLAAGNGSLMRCIATGLVRADPVVRAREAAAISAITHADPRCIDACIAYCDLVAALLDGLPPDAAVELVLRDSPVRPDVRRAIGCAPGRALHALNPSGFVLDTLTIGVWALCCRASLEDVLIEVVNLGGDSDTTGAVAGGLLGVRDGAASIPRRWLDVLEYRERLAEAAGRLAELRRRGERTIAGRWTSR